MKYLLLNYALVKRKSPCGKQQQIKPCTDEIVFFAADIEPCKCTAAVSRRNNRKNEYRTKYLLPASLHGVTPRFLITLFARKFNIERNKMEYLIFSLS